MKKLTTLALTAIALSALPILTAAPAQAGEDKIEACHATGNGGYTSIAANYNAFVKAGHGGHEADIYDGFSYKTKVGDIVNDPGSNWDTVVANGWTGKEIFLNGCIVPAPADIVVNPINPVLVEDATCIDTNGRVEVPAQPEGVTYGTSQPKWNELAEHWVVTFFAAEGYVFPDGTKETTWTQTVTTPDPADCSLPEVGFDTGALPWIAGGALILGAGALTVSRRRNA